MLSARDFVRFVADKTNGGSSHGLPRREENISGTTKRIVIVGATGAGKSASLNLIATCGRQTVFEEAPPGSVFPQTTQVAEFELSETVFNQRIVLVDSPGINDDLDYTLQRDLLQRLQELDDIAVVVFCCPFNVKMTPEFKETMQYYSRVFEPVMRDGRFGLFFTHLNGDTYQQMLREQKDGGQRISDMIDEKAKAITKEFNIQFSFAWLMGKIFPYQVDTVEQEHEIFDSRMRLYCKEQLRRMEDADDDVSRQSSAQSNHMSAPFPRSIGCMSLETRKNLLDFVVRTNCTSLKSHAVPLPPAMENARRIAVNVVNRLLEMKEETIKVTQPNQSKLLAKKTASVKIELLRREHVRELEREIEFLQGEQSCTFAKGMDNIFEFMRYSNLFKGNIPIEPHDIVPTLYQCKIDNARYDPDAKKYVFDIVPNFFNLFRDELDGEWHRWFCHLTFKWDGRVANKNKIEDKREELQRARSSVEEQVAETAKITSQYSESDIFLKSHEEHRKQLTDDLERLQQSLFKLSEFGQIDETLSRYKSTAVSR